MPTINELNNEKLNKIEKVRKSFAPYVSNLAAKDFVAIFNYEFEKLLGDADIEEAFKNAEKLRGILKAERTREVEFLQNLDASLDIYYFDAVHRALILLATYWPGNIRESGEMEAPITMNLLEPETDVIPVSEGLLYEKAIMIQHFSPTPGVKNRGYLEEKNGAQHFVDPGEAKLTRRDLEHLARNGVAIQEVPNPGPEVEAPVVDVAAALPAADAVAVAAALNPEDNSNRTFREYLSDMYHVAFDRGADFGLRLRRVFKPKTAAQWGMFLFTLVGGIASAAVLLQASLVGLTGLAAVATLSAPVFGAVAISSIVAGVAKLCISAYRGEMSYGEAMSANWTTIASAVASLILIGLVAFAAPYVLGFLASASIISAAVAATIMSGLFMMQMAIPIVMGLLGLGQEFRASNGMPHYFTNVLFSVFTIPGTILGLVGASIGAVGSFFGRLLFGSSQPAAIPPVGAAPVIPPNNPPAPPVVDNSNNPPQPNNDLNNDHNNDPAPDNNAGFGSHANIMNGLGVNNDNVFYDPVTKTEEDEMKAALGEEGWQEAVEANRRLLAANGLIAHPEDQVNHPMVNEVHQEVHAQADNVADQAAAPNYDADSDNSDNYSSSNNSDDNSSVVDSDDENHSNYGSSDDENDPEAAERLNELRSLPLFGRL